eukprot:UN02109
MDSKISAAVLVEKEIDYRLGIDLLFDELIEYVISYINDDNYKLTNDNIDAIKYGHIRPSNYQCLKYVYSQYENNCERFTDYSLKYVNSLVNLCEIFDDANAIKYAITNICQYQ